MRLVVGSSVRFAGVEVALALGGGVDLDIDVAAELVVEAEEALEPCEEDDADDVDVGESVELKGATEAVAPSSPELQAAVTAIPQAAKRTRGERMPRWSHALRDGAKGFGSAP